MEALGNRSQRVLLFGQPIRSAQMAHKHYAGTMLQCVVNCGQSCFDALSIGYLAILKRHVEIDPGEVKKPRAFFCKNNENLSAILDKINKT